MEAPQASAAEFLSPPVLGSFCILGVAIWQLTGRRDVSGDFGVLAQNVHARFLQAGAPFAKYYSGAFLISLIFWKIAPYLSNQENRATLDPRYILPVDAVLSPAEYKRLATYTSFLTYPFLLPGQLTFGLLFYQAVLVPASFFFCLALLELSDSAAGGGSIRRAGRPPCSGTPAAGAVGAAAACPAQGGAPSRIRFAAGTAAALAVTALSQLLLPGAMVALNRIAPRTFQLPELHSPKFTVAFIAGPEGVLASLVFYVLCRKPKIFGPKASPGGSAGFSAEPRFAAAAALLPVLLVAPWPLIPTWLFGGFLTGILVAGISAVSPRAATEKGNRPETPLGGARQPGGAAPAARPAPSAPARTTAFGRPPAAAAAPAPPPHLPPVLRHFLSVPILTRVAIACEALVIALLFNTVSASWVPSDAPAGGGAGTSVLLRHLGRSVKRAFNNPASSLYAVMCTSDPLGRAAAKIFVYGLYVLPFVPAARLGSVARGLGAVAALSLFYAMNHPAGAAYRLAANVARYFD